MRRRDFIRLIGTAAAWPLVASAQHRTMPVVGVLSPGTLDADINRMNAIRQGLKDAGYIEGENSVFGSKADITISGRSARQICIWPAMSAVARANNGED